MSDYFPFMEEQKDVNGNQLPPIAAYYLSIELHENHELLIAVLRRDIVFVKQLIKNKANVNQLGIEGYTPLFYACITESFPIAKLLIENKANVNQYTNNLGFNPLSIASLNQQLPLVELLLKNKANINCSDFKGRTPLINASNHGILSVVEFLIENKANVNYSDKNGYTALDLANSASFKQSKYTKIVDCLKNAVTKVCTNIHISRRNRRKIRKSKARRTKTLVLI